MRGTDEYSQLMPRKQSRKTPTVFPGFCTSVKESVGIFFGLKYRCIRTYGPNNGNANYEKNEHRSGHRRDLRWPQNLRRIMNGGRCWLPEQMPRVINTDCRKVKT